MSEKAKQAKRKTMKHTKRSLRYSAISWIVMTVAALIAYIMYLGLIVFPLKYKLLLALILLLIIGGTGAWVALTTKMEKPKTIVNLVLAAVLLITGSMVPSINKRLKNIFNNTTSQEMRISLYAMSEDYKKQNSDLFMGTETSENLADYANSVFITQTQVDRTNQAYAVDNIKEQLSKDSINILEKSDVFSAVEALYGNQGQVLILSTMYAESLTDFDEFRNFFQDTVEIGFITRTVEVPAEEESPKEPEVQNLTNTPFQIFIGGSDTRYSMLSTYGRLDVDLIMTVNPNTRQILLMSIPRDYYVKNPALGNSYDKLTHLGNDGIENSIAGLDQVFGTDIKNYVGVNFYSFINIVDALGGVDVENPYEFSAAHFAAEGKGYYYPAGNIHLSGDEALYYVRERYSLPNGDYGRNEHQMIMLKSILEKASSASVISHANDLLDALQGQFLTNISTEDIYDLVNMQLNEGGEWDFISYHLGGVGTYDGTVSMGWDRQLYVVYPLLHQVEFAKEQMNKMLNGEVILQQELPAEDGVTYLP